MAKNKKSGNSSVSQQDIEPSNNKSNNNPHGMMAKMVFGTVSVGFLMAIVFRPEFYPSLFALVEIAFVAILAYYFAGRVKGNQ